MGSIEYEIGLLPTIGLIGIKFIRVPFGEDEYIGTWAIDFEKGLELSRYSAFFKSLKKLFQEAPYSPSGFDIHQVGHMLVIPFKESDDPYEYVAKFNKFMEQAARSLSGEDRYEPVAGYYNDGWFGGRLLSNPENFSEFVEYSVESGFNEARDQVIYFTIRQISNNMIRRLSDVNADALYAYFSSTPNDYNEIPHRFEDITKDEIIKVSRSFMKSEDAWDVYTPYVFNILPGISSNIFSRDENALIVNLDSASDTNPNGVDGLEPITFIVKEQLEARRTVSSMHYSFEKWFRKVCNATPEKPVFNPYTRLGTWNV